MTVGLAEASEAIPVDLGVGVRELHRLLDDLTRGREVDPNLSDEELRVVHTALIKAKARIDSVAMTVALGLHRRDAARAVGAVSTGHLLAADFGGDRTDANRMVRTAAQLTNAPAVEETLAAGDIDRTQAGLIAGALTKLPSATPAKDKERAAESLLRAAQQLPVEDLARAARRASYAFAARAAADRHEDGQLVSRERRARCATRFSMADNRDGTWRGTFVLPDKEAEMVRAAVEAFSAPRRAHLHDDGFGGTAAGSTATASSRAATGGPVAAGGTASSAAPASSTTAAAPNGTAVESDSKISGPLATEEQVATDWLPMDRRHREGRAFAIICSHLPTDRLPNAGGMTAVLTVNVDYDTVTGQLGPGTLPSGERISAGAVRELACVAGIIPQVLGGRPLPLDLGRARRFFSATQRRALAHRDRGCIYPGCDRPAAWTEAHHWRNRWSPTHPDEQPGVTDIADGCLLCARHHHLVHDRDIQIRERNGYLELLTPPVIGSRAGPGYDGDLFDPDPGWSGQRQWQRNHRWRA